MKLIPTLLILALLATAARAEGILDQQLGPTTPEAKPSAEKPAAKPEEIKPNRPVGAELIDPNSAKAIDDADLVRKLTNTGDAAHSSENGPEATMNRMIDRMGQSQQRLTDKDTGNMTQETQRRITADLDVMIEYARQQNQKSQSKPNPDQQKGQQRQQSSGQQQGSQSQGGTQAAQTSSLPGGGIRPAESNGQDIHQKGPQEWGGLPGRDRDLIFNGANEQYLPAYKEMIDRYYQALAEIGKNK